MAKTQFPQWGFVGLFFGHSRHESESIHQISALYYFFSTFQCPHGFNDRTTIINYRMAMRRNNSVLAQSAVHKIGDLFHGRNHPFYQLIEVYFMTSSFGNPEEVNDLLDKYFTISMSSDESKGEDWDFLLENVNEITQSWVPKGVPNEAMWKTACRNTDKLLTLSTTHHDLIGVKQRKVTGYRKHNLS